MPRHAVPVTGRSRAASQPARSLNHLAALGLHHRYHECLPSARTRVIRSRQVRRVFRRLAAGARLLAMVTSAAAAVLNAAPRPRGACDFGFDREAVFGVRDSPDSGRTIIAPAALT